MSRSFGGVVRNICGGKQAGKRFARRVDTVPTVLQTHVGTVKTNENSAIKILEPISIKLLNLSKAGQMAGWPNL